MKPQRTLGGGMICLVVCVLMSAWGRGARAAEKPAGRLKLRDNSSLAGTLSPSSGANRIVWMSPTFQGPLEFGLDAVGAAVFPAPSVLPSAEGRFGFELAGGTWLTGDLVSFDADAVVASLSSQSTPVRMARDVIQRIVERSAETGLVYSGPVGADGWIDESGNTNVREAGGQLVIEGPGSLVANPGLPDEMVCDLELSWRGDPDFGFQLGVVNEAKETPAKPRKDVRAKRRPTPAASSALRPFNLEVVDGRLVALGENDSKLGLSAIEPLSRPGGRIRLKIFLDQVRGRFVVFNAAGELRADLTLPHPDRQPGTAVRLICRSGAVRLESLRIRQWNGEVPLTATAEASPGKGRRSILRYDEVLRYEPQSGSFVVRKGRSGEEVVPVGEFPGIAQSIRVSRPAPAVSVTTFDGARISGTIESIQETLLKIKSPGIEPAVAVPLVQLSQLAVQEPRNRSPAGNATGRLGVLQTATDRIQGWLTDSSSSPEPGQLVWQTALARNAQPLSSGVSGKILYGEVKSRRGVAVEESHDAAVLRVANAERRLREPTREDGQIAAERSPDSEPERLQLHLRTGDVLPGVVAEMDGQGVRIRNEEGVAAEIPHADVQVLELIPGKLDEAVLREEQRARLLTLPRLQQGSPPTHLLRSISGDFLRGEVLAMDEQTIELRIRQIERALPRHLISHIFWLHPEDLDSPGRAHEPASGSIPVRVQSLGVDGSRLTLQPEGLTGRILTGSHRFLGECRVDLSAIDQLILGAEIERSVAQLELYRWRLQPAIVPRAFSSTGGSPIASADAGTDSVLVGQAAPDFRLGQLEGPSVHLKRLRGKVVVLEFWATWCEPCWRRLPAVAAGVAPFPADDVVLIAVNLQEQREPIEALLARLQLNLTVVLDVEGLTAQSYDALALPQTVIVDREGKIARVYGGGRNDLEGAIRRGLSELLESQ